MVYKGTYTATEINWTEMSVHWVQLSCTDCTKQANWQLSSFRSVCMCLRNNKRNNKCSTPEWRLSGFHRVLPADQADKLKDFGSRQNNDSHWILAISGRHHRAEYVNLLSRYAATGLWYSNRPAQVNSYN